MTKIEIICNVSVINCGQYEKDITIQINMPYRRIEILSNF